MALPIYAEFDGIECESTRGGDFATMAEIYQLDYSVDRPTDADSGRATGDRVHRPFRFLKAIDKGSPLLAQKLVNGDVIERVVFHFYKIDPGSGEQVEYYTVTLSNATVVKINLHMPLTLDDATRQYPNMEWVELRFNAITYTYVDGNIEFEDSWTR